MTLSLRIDVRGVQDALNRSDLALRYVAGALNQGAVEIQRDAQRAAPIANGALRGGIQVGRLQQLLFVVNSRAAHGRYVELGTRPHARFLARTARPAGAGGEARVPSQFETNIAQWLSRKGIQGRDGTSRGRLAFLIARSIARRGTRPQPYLGPQATERTALRITDLVERAMQRGINEAGLG